MQYYRDCKYLQLLFCILFFLSTLHCFVWCKLILFGKYCSHRTVSIVSIATFLNKCCVLKKKSNIFLISVLQLLGLGQWALITCSKSRNALHVRRCFITKDSLNTTLAVIEAHPCALFHAHP